MDDRLNGLLPLNDYRQIPVNSNFIQPKPKTYTYHELYNPPPVDETGRAPKVVYDRPYVQQPTQIVPDTEKAPPSKKKRKTSVEGDSINELVLNIIKDKPNVIMTRKAIKKMADMIEDEKDDLEFI